MQEARGGFALLTFILWKSKPATSHDVGRAFFALARRSPAAAAAAGPSSNHRQLAGWPRTCELLGKALLAHPAHPTHHHGHESITTCLGSNRCIKSRRSVEARSRRLHMTVSSVVEALIELFMHGARRDPQADLKT